jgi:hypothetical protein
MAGAPHKARQIAHIEDGLVDLDAGRVHTHEEIEDLVRGFERLAVSHVGSACRPYTRMAFL